MAHQAAHVNEGLVRINIAENMWQRCVRPARGRVEAGSDGVRVPGPRWVKGMNRVPLLHTPCRIESLLECTVSTKLIAYQIDAEK